ncbi:hypothetical protein TD95_003865 [Thielaviopsis punctulata]|uniref:DNA repair protein RAD5 n=1 Tax=Thielaviopsis punctulata TaxID=72032 RepID=A0A0F4ZI57_9PEZI|nr:hypothetical protein TD95_003865 [Thielaviopsis punctulata]
MDSSEPPHKKPRTEEPFDHHEYSLSESYLKPLLPAKAEEKQTKTKEKKRFFTNTLPGAVAAARAAGGVTEDVGRSLSSAESAAAVSGFTAPQKLSLQTPEPRQNTPESLPQTDDIPFDQDTFTAFVGTTVSLDVLAVLRAHCRNDLQRAVNMYLDGTWRNLSVPAHTSRSLQAPKTLSSTKSPLSIKGSLSAKNPPATSRYIGVFGVEGWATRSGSGLLRYGDPVTIERHRSPTTKPSNLRGSKPSAGLIVRFTNTAGQEVGRLARDAAEWISALQDQHVAIFSGTVVYVPERLRINDTVHMQLRVELLSSAFDQAGFQGPDVSARGLFEQDETSEERDLRMRQVALVKLFTEINLLPLTAGTRDDSTRRRRENLIKAVELDEQKARENGRESGSGALTPRPLKSGPFQNAFSQNASSQSTPNPDSPEADQGLELEQDQLDALYRKAQSFDFSTPCATPAASFAMRLRPYQQQALHWMMSKEKDEKTHREPSLHPLWEEYQWPTRDADGAEVPAVYGRDKFYVNPYSGEMSLEFQAQEQSCLGGILADEMGLGKTIQMLSLIHSHRLPTAESVVGESFLGSEPESEPQSRFASGPGSSVSTTQPDSKSASRSGSPKSKPENNNAFSRLSSKKDSVQDAPQTTLVIAPMSLLAQWHSEAEKASKPGTLRVSVYYGADKNSNLQALCTAAASAPDVLITSYGTVLSEFSQLAARNGDRSWHTGLFSLRFFRVILDEAHTIKNRTSKTAKACYALSATHRWALTGTPVVNRLEDLFSLVRFLGVEPWNNFSYWRTFITLPFEARNFVRALDVVQTVLEPLVMRRTKDMKTPTGDPLVPLPPKTVEIVEVELSQTERAIYDHVFAMARNSLSENMANGTVLKSYTSIFAQILRLRQVCCHPILVRNQNLVAEEAEVAALADAADGMTDDMDLDNLIQQFTANVADAGNSNSLSASAFGAHALSEIRKEADAECPICADEPMNEQTVTACWHSACKKCLLEYMRHESDRGRQPRCVTCRKPINGRELYEVVRYDEDEIDGHEEGEKAEAEEKRGKISLQRLGTHDSSSKVMALIAHLRAQRKAEPNSKSVVFSQFTSFLSIIEPALQRAHIRFLRLDGSMPQKARAAVLADFAAAKRFTVLLLSLKAGGVGLNLTSAKTVYMMDPWWSFAVEAQAIDRVHRMGQTESVKVFRFIVKSSVEGRMLKIQERKKFLATSLGMMGDEEKRLARIEDIKELLS